MKKKRVRMRKPGSFYVITDWSEGNVTAILPETIYIYIYIYKKGEREKDKDKEK